MTDAARLAYRKRLAASLLICAWLIFRVSVLRVTSMSYSEYAVDHWSYAYGLNPDRLWSMVMCESSGNPHAIGPDSSDGRPYGILQIKPATWVFLMNAENDDPSLAPNLTVNDPEIRSEDADDGAAEIHVTSWAIFRGYSYLWECKY